MIQKDPLSTPQPQKPSLSGYIVSNEMAKKKKKKKANFSSCLSLVEWLLGLSLSKVNGYLCCLQSQEYSDWLAKMNLLLERWTLLVGCCPRFLQLILLGAVVAGHHCGDLDLYLAELLMNYCLAHSNPNLAELLMNCHCPNFPEQLIFPQEGQFLSHQRRGAC
jgi:hypothetical protein